MKINKKLIKELVNCLEENKLSELEYSEKELLEFKNFGKKFNLFTKIF